MLRALHPQSRWEPQAVILATLRPALPAALLLILMHAGLPAGFYALAISLYAALLVRGGNPLAPTLGVLLGALRLPLREIAPAPLISCALMLPCVLLARRLKIAHRLPAESSVSLLAGFATLLGALALGDYAWPAVLGTLSAAVLAAAAAPLFLAACALRRNRRHLSAMERAGLMLMLGALELGLYNLLPAAAMLAATFTVLAAGGAGAALGALAALALMLGGLPPDQSLLLPLIGGIGGLSIFRDRYRRAAATCIAALALSLATGTAYPLPLIASAGIYMLLPAERSEEIRRLAENPIECEIDPDRIARDVCARTQTQLRALGEAFDAMADAWLEPGDVPDEQELIARMRTRLCTGCPGYGECWAGSESRAVHLLCRLIGEALRLTEAPAGARVLYADGEIPPDILRACRRGRMIPDRLGLLLRDFTEKRRAGVKRCQTAQLLSVQLTQARDLVYDMAQRQARPVTLKGRQLERAYAALERAEIGDCRLTACEIDGLDICLSKRADGWTRTEARRASAALRQALGGDFLPEARSGRLYLHRRPAARARTGAACTSGVAGAPSGDSQLIRRLDENRLLLMLSDGMGSGEAAQAESLRTIGLLWRFLSAGIALEIALETLNQLLMARSGEDMFATLDLCVIDLAALTAQFVKLAACPSLVLRGAEQIEVAGGRLPLGILSHVQPAVTRLRLCPGDRIVLGSDGVMEAGDALFIRRALIEDENLSAQALAEKLVRLSALRRAQTRPDDMTCLIARIEA